jgi:translation initiation factor IF-2
LKRFQEDVTEVKEGLECGIGLSNSTKYKEGDIIEVYETNEIKRKLELI